jgi:hypothetical protein
MTLTTNPSSVVLVYKLLGSFNINFVNVGLFETKYILCVILLKNVKVSLTLFFNNIQIQTILFNWVNDQWFWIFAVGEIERKKTRVSIISITATDYLRTEAEKNGIFTFSIPGSSITLSKLYPELVCLRLRNSFVNIVRRSDHTTGGTGVHTSKGEGGTKKGPFQENFQKTKLIKIP